jgi:hypothetical protein
MIEKGEVRIVGWANDTGTELFKENIIALSLSGGALVLETIRPDGKGPAIQVEIYDLMQFIASRFTILE